MRRHALPSEILLGVKRVIRPLRFFFLVLLHSFLALFEEILVAEYLAIVAQFELLLVKLFEIGAAEVLALAELVPNALHDLLVVVGLLAVREIFLHQFKEGVDLSRMEVTL